MAATYILGFDALVPDLDSDVHHGLARGADSDRGRHPLFVEVTSGGVLGALVRSSLPTLLVVTSADRELLERAEAAAANAYAPYSEFHVGAAVRTRDGRIFEGVNVENAAYPLGICGERPHWPQLHLPACVPVRSRRWP